VGCAHGILFPLLRQETRNVICSDDDIGLRAGNVRMFEGLTSGGRVGEANLSGISRSNPE